MTVAVAVLAARAAATLPGVTMTAIGRLIRSANSSGSRPLAITSSAPTSGLGALNQASSCSAIIQDGRGTTLRHPSCQVRRKSVMKVWSVIVLLFAAAIFATIPISPQVTTRGLELGVDEAKAVTYGHYRRVHRRVYRRSYRYARRAYRRAYYWGASSYYYGARSYYAPSYYYGGYYGRRFWW
jgi:hypothetical protein